jgi:glycosyltransferase involved in cell wall biosynthesis
VLLVADFTSGLFTEAQRCGLLQSVRDAGVSVSFTVYDLLPIRMPQMFPPGTGELHAQWVQAGIAAADRAVCISRAVADELSTYVESTRPPGARPLKIEWFHLGADLDGSIPTGGMPEGSAQVLVALRTCPSFLMVGTVEPRKGHAQALAGFESLWARGQDVNLVVVGKRGWMVDAVCDRMRSHPEAGQRLFWIEGASDEYLQALYGASRCLIAASEGEGFGLPLIEAAQHGLPIIARDIPVFREVAGSHASYFSGESGEALADSVQAWLHRWEAGTAPHSEGMPWLTWRQSAKRVLQCLQLDNGTNESPDDAGQQATATDPSILSSRT